MTAAVLVIAGLFGIVLPALPGTPLIVIGLWLAAWADEFRRVGVGTLVVISLIGVASSAVDLGVASLGTRRVGASRRAVVGAGLGMAAGLVFGLPGMIIGRMNLPSASVRIVSAVPDRCTSTLGIPSPRSDVTRPTIRCNE